VTAQIPQYKRIADSALHPICTQMACTSPFGLTASRLHDYVERTDVIFARARVLLLNGAVT
jgi:hypothetical protein